MKNRKLITMLGSVALVAALGVGATLAYFTDNDTKKNVITMGHVDITLTEEDFVTENPDYSIENIVPGDEITKDPTITVNAGSEDAYIRVKLVVGDVVDDEGNVIEPGITAEQKEQLLEKDEDGNYKYLDIDTNSWRQSGDYFYYIGTKYPDKPGVLKANDTVELFSKVTIPFDWDNSVVDSSFTINLTAEAIQADNFVPSENTEGEYGWFYDNEPVTVENYVAPTTPAN